MAYGDGPAVSSAARPRMAAERAVDVSWFDIRQIALGPADLAELDVRETARAAAFVFPADRHRYQVAHVMLRRVLAGHLGTDPSRLNFGRQRCPTCGGVSGKPVLAGVSAWDDDPEPRRGVDAAWPGLSFSLAHSGEAVAIALGRVPVGIDVERDATGCVCSLASAMHHDDAAIVEVLPEPERHLAVIRWWVRAEAVLKCAGTGIAHGMDAFPVLGAPVLSGGPGPAGAADDPVSLGAGPLTGSSPGLARNPYR